MLNLLKSEIESVANSGGSTVFSFDMAQVFTKTSFIYAELRLSIVEYRGRWIMAQYHFPQISWLKDSEEHSSFTELAYVEKLKQKLNEMFADFGVDATVSVSNHNAYSILLKLRLGPDVTPGAIRRLRNDIELHLDGNPVDFMDAPDGHGITIAVKNARRPGIVLKEVIRSSAFQEAASRLTVAAGVNLFGGYMTIDLASLPNLIVLGVTGAGKTTFLNDIILSILFKAKPDEVRMVMIDTKGVDLTHLDGIPHMEGFAVADSPSKGIKILKWLMNEAVERVSLMRQKRTDTIGEYNKYSKEKKPRILLIIDEYTDFRDRTKENIDEMIVFLAQQSASTGIHIVLATQGAYAKQLPTSVQEAIPSRACLVVASTRESRIALDRTGAERLAGDGDMIFTRDENDPGVRIQAALATDEEIDRVAAFLRNEEAPD